MALVHLLKADLDPDWAPISGYALGDHGWASAPTSRNCGGWPRPGNAATAILADLTDD